MKTEQIRKRAASLFSNAIDQTIYRQGAMWRINSVWHRADEMPDEKDANGKGVLFMDSDGSLFHGAASNWLFSWNDLVNEIDLTAWAYVDDLLPDTFDEILEANKDVLKRIKEKGD